MSEPRSTGAAPVDTEEAEELLIDLVSIPSPSRSESACAAHLLSFFEAHDRDVWIDDVGNVRAPANDGVLLTSHIDTVPGDIPVRVSENELWGRGSVDAKGPLATMAAAAVNTGASFAGVVREEVDSGGAHHLVAERDAPAALINGEPSGWAGITLGYRGLLGGTYVSTSESGHTSRPTQNAIQHAMQWWHRVEETFTPDQWDSIFEQVTTKPISMQAGPSDDGLSVEAVMDVQLRVPPDMSTDAVRERADGELEHGTVNWWDDIPPVMESPRTSVARAFRVAIREAGGDPRLLRKTGTSDMNVFADQWDIPMVTYGPGDSALDHAPNERLDLDEFERALTVLTHATRRILE